MFWVEDQQVKGPEAELYLVIVAKGALAMGSPVEMGEVKGKMRSQ